MPIDTFIVKIQTPLFSTEEDAKALVYNEDKTLMVEIPNDAALRAWMRGRPKAFFVVRVDGDAVTILSRTTWKDW